MPPSGLSTADRYFFTGELCRNGHLSDRYVTTGGCVTCAKLAKKRNYLARAEHWKEIERQRCRDNREAFAKRTREYRLANLEAVRAQDKRNYLANKANKLAGMKKWREKNPQLMRGYKQRWARNNPLVIAANVAKRRDRLAKATLRGLSSDWRDEIAEFYVEANRLSRVTGTPHHVDHIHPLRSKTLCGLHVPWNLQIITAANNFAKSNSFPKHLLFEEPQ